MSVETGETAAKPETGKWPFYLTLAAVMALFTVALSTAYGLGISGPGAKSFENFVIIVQQIILVLVPISAVYRIFAHIERNRQGFIPAAVEALVYLAGYVVALFAVMLIVTKVLVLMEEEPCEDVVCWYRGIASLYVSIMAASVLAPIYSWAFIKWRRNYWSRQFREKRLPND